MTAVMSLICVFLRLQKFINRLAVAESIQKNCPNSPSVYRGSTAKPGGSSKQSAEFRGVA